MTPDKYIYTAEVVPYTDIRLPFTNVAKKAFWIEYEYETALFMNIYAVYF